MILADKQFQKCDLRFNEHARFATIDRFFLTKLLDTRIRNSLSWETKARAYHVNLTVEMRWEIFGGWESTGLMILRKVIFH